MPYNPTDDAPIAPLPHLAVQAFCLTSDVARSLDDASRDRRMARVHYQRMDGGISGAASAFHNAPTPNVLIVETVQSREQVLHELDSLAEVCDADTKVIVIGHVNDVVLYRELIRRGVSDYVVQPFQPLDFVRILADLYQSGTSQPIGRMVAFFGVRGGVGSSTLAHNVAVAASAELDRDALVVDFDLPFGTAGLNFNLDPSLGMGDALFAPEKVDAVFLDRLMVNYSERVRLLSAPATLDTAYDLPETAADNLFETLRRMVPLVVADLPHQWTGLTRRILTLADDIVLVASPDLASLRNAKTAYDTLQRLRNNDHPPYLVMSQTGVPKRPEIKPDEFRKTLGTDILADIPFDPAVFGASANEGRPVIEAARKSGAAKSIVHMATVLGGRQAHAAGASQQAASNSIIVNLIQKINGGKRAARG